MLIFDKEINLKTYDCSKDGINYDTLEIPIINLYIQTTPKCNAKCDFCNTRCVNDIFDFEKLKLVIKKLKEKNIVIGKVAITGGEPLLEMERISNILDICNDMYLTLNTNAFDIERLKVFGKDSRIKEIHISKHHYDNNINDKIMSIKTPSIETLALLDFANKIKINCVWQKGGIENYSDLISMMEILGVNGIKELRNISLLPLNEKSIEKYIDLTTIMKECEEFLNNGYLYDKHMCKCLEFVYLSKSGGIVKNIIRQTFDDNYDCVKQFVYDGQFLYDGFKKNNILI